MTLCCYSLKAGKSSLCAFKQIFGAQQASLLSPIYFERTRNGFKLKVEGYLSQPGTGRRTKDQQYLYVNRRWISDTFGLHRNFPLSSGALLI
eukprot:SAG31_NODE_525_length_14489_cov_3.693815_15_plen_92_part_00